MDGITDLSCKNGITHYGVDGWEATHNRSVAGSSSPGRLSAKWLLCSVSMVSDPVGGSVTRHSLPDISSLTAATGPPAEEADGSDRTARPARGQ